MLGFTQIAKLIWKLNQILLIKIWAGCVPFVCYIYIFTVLVRLIFLKATRMLIFFIKSTSASWFHNLLNWLELLRRKRALLNKLRHLLLYLMLFHFDLLLLLILKSFESVLLPDFIQQWKALFFLRWFKILYFCWALAIFPFFNGSNVLRLHSCK